MATLIKTTNAETLYDVQLNQSEVDFIMGIIADLGDNPQRKVGMLYEVDRTLASPSEKGMETIKSILSAGLETVQSDEYDYFDYWNEVEAEVNEED